MPTHTVSKRNPTQEEILKLSSSTRMDILSWTCMFLVCLFWYFLLDALGGWIGDKFDKEELGHLIGRGLAIAYFISTSASYYKWEKKQREKANKDLNKKNIEEIEIETGEVYEIDLINNNEPILCFNIGDSKLLYLQGQWLRDYSTYGLSKDPCIDDLGEDSINSLPEPYGFPRTKFKVTRATTSGEVFKIELSGEYLKPKKNIDALKSEYDFNMSEIFEGGIEHLPSILESEHKKNTQQKG